MIKKQGILFIAIIFVLGISLFTSFSNTQYSDIPTLEVTYQGEQINVGQGSYRWKSRGEEKYFTVESYANVITKLIPAANIKNNSQLQLQFDYQPETITISNGTTVNDIKITKDNYINILKEENGMQVYFIEGRWKEGTATYVVVVQVQD